MELKLIPIDKPIELNFILGQSHRSPNRIRAVGHAAGAPARARALSKVPARVEALMKIFVPPIKCQGIKTKLVQWIVENVSLANSERWIEPFMGSGVVGFNLRPRQAIFSDINPHLINFYNALKSGEITPIKAKAFLLREGGLLEQKGQSHYYTIRERFNDKGNPLDFLFLNRAGFNGVIRFNRKGLFNVPFGHKPQRFSKSYITKIINQIDYVATAMHHYEWEFVCSDFRAVISQADSNDFIYCDPPYIGRHTDYFNAWAETDEQDLYALLSNIPAKFILSTWHSNQYRTNVALGKYADSHLILTREHFYHVGASEENRNSMLEAIVLNYTPTAYAPTEEREHQLVLLEK
jgi:DNA adenine methylase